LNRRQAAKSSFSRLLAALLILFSLTACTTRVTDYDQVGPKDKLIIRFSFVTGEDTPKGLASIRFKELVEKRSNGKVEVQIFPNSTLYSDAQELDELKLGDVQMIAPAISKLSEIVPEVQLFDLPFLFQSQQDVWSLADGPVGQELFRLLEKKGYKALAVWDNGFKDITNSRHSIKEPSDFSDLTFRIMPSETLQKQFEAVGATTVVVPFDELYFSLEKGQVEGEENTISNIYNKKLYTSQRFLTKSDHGYLGYFVLVDQKFWSTIPPDTRKMLTETLQEVTDWERQLAMKKNEQEFELLQQRKDVQITMLDKRQKSQWRESFQSTYTWFMSQVHDDLIRDYLKQKETQK
jgi:tripartite ATP-independent transporter DctP family solute receptor